MSLLPQASLYESDIKGKGDSSSQNHHHKNLGSEGPAKKESLRRETPTAPAIKH